MSDSPILPESVQSLLNLPKLATVLTFCGITFFVVRTFMHNVKKYFLWEKFQEYWTIVNCHMGHLKRTCGVNEEEESDGAHRPMGVVYEVQTRPQVWG